jgi:hypothetical protein
MKTAKTPLMNLPTETKELINQGIFSLYALSSTSSKENNADFVLYTGMHAFLLDYSGTVVRELGSKVKFDIRQAINFPEINSSKSFLFKLNSA